MKQSEINLLRKQLIDWIRFFNEKEIELLSVPMARAEQEEQGDPVINALLLNNHPEQPFTGDGRPRDFSDPMQTFLARLGTA
jgi:hypothetical protein